MQSMRIVVITFLLLLLLFCDAFAYERSAHAKQDFTGVYELVSMKGNMYPNGPPKRRLEVTQSESSINVVRIEGEKQWVMNVQLGSQKAEDPDASTFPEHSKVQIKGDELMFEVVKMIPPEMTRPASRETQVWKLVDGGKKAPDRKTHRVLDPRH